MLKQWLDPLLLLIGLTSGLFYMHSSQQAYSAPSSAVHMPMPPSGGLVPPSGQTQPPPGTPVPPTLQDVDAMLVIDNSGSMFGHTCMNGDPIAANDRNNMRIRSAEIVIASLAADLKPRNTKLGIVSFGNSAVLVSQLQQLSNNPGDPMRSDLSSKIQKPPCAGDTNIVEALRVAQAELHSERHDSANIPAIIFLTDGIPTLGGGDQEIRQILDEFQAEKVMLFTVLLGDDSQIAAFGRFWQAESDVRPDVHYYRLSSADEMVEVYQNIKAKLNNLDDWISPPLPPGPSVTVAMPPNVAQAVLTVLKPAVDTQVTLSDPAGVDANQRPPDRFRLLQNNTAIDVFITDRPESGDWVVHSANGEELIVLQPELKSVYAVQLLQPDVLQPLSIDNLTDIVVQVIDETTQAPLPGPFAFTASYRLLDAPASATTPLTLTQSSTGYRVSLPAGTFADLSSYIFTFQAQDSVGLRSNEVTYPLRAGRVPSIVSVVARQRIFVDDENTLTVDVAHPESADVQPVPQILGSVPNNSPVSFTAQTSMTFQAHLKPFKKPGQYTINVLYAGKTRLGTDFHDQKSIQIVVDEHWWTIWLRNIAKMLALLTLIYLVYRYILIPFTPLVPIAQKLKLAPEGYIRVYRNGQPDSQRKITDLLRQRRKLLRLTLGVGKGYDISLSPPSSEDSSAGSDQDDDDDSSSRKKPRPSLLRRLLGKPALAVIGRHFGGATFFQRVSGGQATFTKYSNEQPIADDTVEFSLEELS